MKKWLIALLSVLILFLLACQFLLPATTNVSATIDTRANLAALIRFLDNDSNWPKWWPSGTSGQNMALGDHKFTRAQTGFNSFNVEIETDHEKDSSLLNFLETGADTVKIVWSAQLKAKSNNPFGKIALHMRSRGHKKDLAEILESLNSYVSVVKNLYDIEIRHEKVNIDYVASVQKVVNHYPGTEEIYTIIRSIENHIAKSNVKAEQPPIMNITQMDSNSYHMIVAIPIEKFMESAGEFQTKKLLRNGNMIVTEVQGGIHRIQHALKQLDQYALDHGFRNIAVPFQSPLGDRSKLSDTAQWRTRIGYPIL